MPVTDTASVLVYDCPTLGGHELGGARRDARHALPSGDVRLAGRLVLLVGGQRLLERELGPK
ncbi:MAG TPA: hypothetical protein VHX88_03515 [Solirubrobacteraceae bacterium]|nr:hypothetical protein [Solirubrobacteraceae bacterium]